MKVKEISQRNIDDFEIEIHELLGRDEAGFPITKKSKLILSDIGYSEGTVILEKDE